MMPPRRWSPCTSGPRRSARLRHAAPPDVTRGPAHRPLRGRGEYPRAHRPSLDAGRRAGRHPSPDPSRTRAPRAGHRLCASALPAGQGPDRAAVAHAARPARQRPAAARHHHAHAANAFLPTFLADFNPRFARAAADPMPGWRRPPRDLEVVLSCRYNASSGAITPSSSAPASSRSRPARTAAPMRGAGSTSASCSTAASSSGPTPPSLPPCAPRGQSLSWPRAARPAAIAAVPYLRPPPRWPRRSPTSRPPFPPQCHALIPGNRPLSPGPSPGPLMPTPGDDCQRSPNNPHLWSSKSPHPS